MKFGGSSLASADSITRVISIIRSEALKHPVIVASAIGNTTDLLLEVLAAARRGNSYSAWKLQETIKDQHFAVCEELLHGAPQRDVSQYLAAAFRELHVRMLELCEGEICFTPELQDWTLSWGEQLASRLLAAILQEHCGSTVHLDARKLISTDAAFTNAVPRYWETYARLRWSVPVSARENLVVLGGFMGSTEDGRTTTLGRGGSDLTASIVGTAINAEEIQFWKDVDGMLTCDPRMLNGARRVRRLSYDEASELARAGATILHPETIAPAQRLRIPIVIRNTFRPEGEGTRIENGPLEGSSPVKAMAIQTNPAPFDPSFVPPGSVILTLVGDRMEKRAVQTKLKTALHGVAALIISGDESACVIRVAVPRDQLTKSIEALHAAFFTNPDSRIFAAQQTRSSKKSTAFETAPASPRQPQSFVFSPSLLQPN